MKLFFYTICSSIIYLCGANSTYAANHTAEAGTLTLLSIGDKVKYSFPRGQKVTVVFSSCQPETSTATFVVARRSGGRSMSETVTLTVNDYGPTVSMLKLTSCLCVSAGTASSCAGRALITVPN